MGGVAPNEICQLRAASELDRPADALLRSVAVAPSLRAHGLGQLLTEDRLKWAVKQGIKNAYLLTTDARGYWARYGFHVIGRGEAHPAFKALHNGRADALQRLSRCERLCKTI